MVVSFLFCIFVTETENNSIMEEEKYSLIGVDGNAFGVMAYVQKAMRSEKFTKEEIDAYTKDAMSSDYSHLLQVSEEMVEKCNDKAAGND